MPEQPLELVRGFVFGLVRRLLRLALRLLLRALLLLVCGPSEDAREQA